MSVQETELPRHVERKISNRNDDSWFEYDGEPMFPEHTFERIRLRFEEMREQDYEKIATVKGSNSTRTKIRTKDKGEFVTELNHLRDLWNEEHGDRLTSFGNAMYGETLTDYEVVEISDESTRKTVVAAHYDAGRRAFIGGEQGKKQKILLPIRTFEQWSYQKEVVKPVFEKFHERYPY